MKLISENIVVDEEELNISLRDQGNKKKKKRSANSSLAEKANKMMEKMKNLKKEEDIDEEKSNKSDENSEKEEKEKVLKKNKEKNLKSNKVETGQQTSIRIPNEISIAEKSAKKPKKKKKEKTDSENPKDFESQREKAMKQFYNSFALIEEGKFDRSNDQKLYYSFDDKAKQQEIEEEHDEESEEEEGQKGKKKQKGRKIDENRIDKLIQSKLDKALLDPHVAKKWLDNQNYDKEYGLFLNF